MTDPSERLTPASAEDSPTRSRSPCNSKAGKRVHNADEIMTEIVAGVVAQRVFERRAGFDEVEAALHHVLRLLHEIYPESSRIRESCCVAGDFGFVFRG